MNTLKTQALPTSPEELMARLKKLGIDFTLHHHEAVFTVGESERFKDNQPGAHCRNLFVKDKKDNMALLVVADETQLDLKKFPALLDMGRLSFGSPERLFEYLGVYPGSVCPFAVVNDPNNKVRLVIDSVIMRADLFNCHPLHNEMTVGLAPSGLELFLKECGHDYEVMDFSPAAP